MEDNESKNEYIEMKESKNKENQNSEQLNNLTINNNPAKEFLNFVFDLLKTGVIVFVIAFALRYFAIQPFIVEGESMMPNFVNNEYLLAEKISYLFGQPKRGDVVVFKYPKNPSVNYIKRIIGLPGETVKIENDHIVIMNSEYPNGTILSEEYIPKNYLTLSENGATATAVNVGSNEYFVLGDNRQHSSDSREWGLLPRENISGRAWLSLLPFDHFGIQHRLEYTIKF